MQDQKTSYEKVVQGLNSETSIRARIVNRPKISGNINGNVDASVLSAKGLTAENFEAYADRALELAKGGIYNAPVITANTVVNGTIECGALNFDFSKGNPFSTFKDTPPPPYDGSEDEPKSCISKICSTIASLKPY